jgi:hypothetical protein
VGWRESTACEAREAREGILRSMGRAGTECTLAVASGRVPIIDRRFVCSRDSSTAVTRIVAGQANN